ncbi:GNAT family N-acetyltransferase [Paracoccus yeei]|uniref:GNAT family N-acetyltransferase n=1 Tax=Paracoccus yeei TaxID=147645 RepID=UPI001C8EB9EF|nr:GNAT family N-acetyltransferase [Paracoccus yeei]MBY0137691.1 N-acetyltransferase [Paracoccus yeei]
MAGLIIRDADEADIPAVCAIYNHAVACTTAIWNDRTVDLADRLAWWQGRKQAGYPLLVAVDASGAVMGYASFGDWRAFDGFRHTVEHSVYVAPDRQGAGVGRALMVALIDRAWALGKHVMVAGVEVGNQGSIRLHLGLGFRQVGLMPQVGAKFDRWLDLAFLQLVLDDRAAPDA